jgi:hypothetical protein
MEFLAPIPFEEARQAILKKGLLPTDLDTAGLSSLHEQIRANAVFSAKVTDLRILEKIQSEVGRLVAGKGQGPGDYKSRADVRLALKDLLAEIDYQPKEGEGGTIKDLRTDTRLDLIIETQQRMATGYAQYVKGNTETALNAVPCLEFKRIYQRNTPRGSHRYKGVLIVDNPHYWRDRWQSLGGQVYEGRMIAKKGDPIWADISRFGVPYGPPDFNSGFGQAPVRRREAIRLGIINPGDKAPAVEAVPFLSATDIDLPELPESVINAFLGSAGRTIAKLGDKLVNLLAPAVADTAPATVPSS